MSQNRKESKNQTGEEPLNQGKNDATDVWA